MDSSDSHYRQVEGRRDAKGRGATVDSFLSPLTIDEKNDAIGACANQTRQRCSDKGFLSMSTLDYLELLDASARMVRPDKKGYTPSEVAPIFERLKLDPEYWRLQINNFGRLFANVGGKPKDVYEMRSLISKRRFYLKRLKRKRTRSKGAIFRRGGLASQAVPTRHYLVL